MRIRYTRRALRHVEAIRRFSTRRFGEATSAVTLERIETAISRLADWPESGRPGRVPLTRELAIPGLPFIVAYRVTPASIEILAILHAAQRWPDLLP